MFEFCTESRKSQPHSGSALFLHSDHHARARTLRGKYGDRTSCLSSDYGVRGGPVGNSSRCVDSANCGRRGGLDDGCRGSSPRNGGRCDGVRERIHNRVADLSRRGFAVRGCARNRLACRNVISGCHFRTGEHRTVSGPAGESAPVGSSVRIRCYAVVATLIGRAGYGEISAAHRGGGRHFRVAESCIDSAGDCCRSQGKRKVRKQEEYRGNYENRGQEVTGIPKWHSPVARIAYVEL